MRQALRYYLSALAVRTEGALRRVESWIAARLVHEGEALAFQQGRRDGLAIQFAERGLVVKQFELARPAGHVEVNDALDSGWEVGLLGSHRVGSILGRREVAAQQAAQ